MRAPPWAPALCGILTDGTVRAADALEEAFAAWAQALDDAQDPLRTSVDRAVLLEGRIATILDAFLGLGHRAANADRDRWEQFVAWLMNLVSVFQLDLNVDLGATASTKTSPRARPTRLPGDLASSPPIASAPRLPTFAADPRAKGARAPSPPPRSSCPREPASCNTAAP